MKRNVNLYIGLFLLLGVLLLVAKLVYDFAEQKLVNDSIIKHQTQMHQTINYLIQDQQSSSGTLALSLSENPIIHQLLKQTTEAPHYRKKLSDIVARINHRKGLTNLWVQLIDIEGVSVYRSWTKNWGDSLLLVRPEIQEMIERPESKVLVSVGKFALSFKSMVPVFDESNHLLGMVEIITQFQPLINELQAEDGIESVLLVDKNFKHQLTRVDQTAFLNDYFISNDNASSEFLAWIKKQGVERLVQLNAYKAWNGYVVNRFVLNDQSGRLLAHWLTFTPRALISFESATWVLHKYVILSLAAILVLLLVFSQFINNRHVKDDKRYFRQIIDSVSDIVYITNLRKIVDSNQIFFEFYDEFEDLDAFLKKHRCVCETFVKEDGFLQEQMDGEYWINYILNHPQDAHKAKVMRHG